jgi:hypothetical protein
MFWLGLILGIFIGAALLTIVCALMVSGKSTEYDELPEDWQGRPE